MAATSSTSKGSTAQVTGTDVVGTTGFTLRCLRWGGVLVLRGLTCEEQVRQSAARSDLARKGVVGPGVAHRAVRPVHEWPQPRDLSLLADARDAEGRKGQEGAQPADGVEAVGGQPVDADTDLIDLPGVRRQV